MQTQTREEIGKDDFHSNDLKYCKNEKYCSHLE